MIPLSLHGIWMIMSETNCYFDAVIEFPGQPFVSRSACSTDHLFLLDLDVPKVDS